MRIETEFDRFLMEMDGMDPPHGMRITRHMQLTGPECELVSRFYPGAESRHIRESLTGMVNIRRILEMPEGMLRSAVTKTIGAGSGSFRDMIVRETPDPACRELNQPLLERYQQAAKAFPDMLLQLGAHLTYNAPLGEEFSPIFG